LRPKIKQTAMALWWIYGGLTLAALGLLMAAGMPLYDAICHSMSALATGGYSTRSASIGAYGSATIDWIVSAFMLLAGLNFGLYYGLLRGRWRDFWQNYELRFYLLVNAVLIALMTVLIWQEHGTIAESLRYAAFQTLAVTTTTGFMTEDFDTYPDLGRFALFCAMFMGGCAGSTAGGIKASRVYIMVKLVALELTSLVRPNAVQTVRTGRSSISADVARGIATFFVAYMVLFAFSSICLVGMGLGLVSAMSATVACLSSIGPGLADVGPSQNFGFIPAGGKLLLSMCMIAGRLELFALFAIFSPETWRR
jgi:trk system potassium uptake protein TrkH